MFYAEYCPYGVRTISESDRVMRFATRAERDEMVERLNAAHWESVEGVCAPITRKDAARRNREKELHMHHQAQRRLRRRLRRHLRQRAQLRVRAQGRE